MFFALFAVVSTVTEKIIHCVEDSRLERAESLGNHHQHHQHAGKLTEKKGHFFLLFLVICIFNGSENTFDDTYADTFVLNKMLRFDDLFSG